MIEKQGKLFINNVLHKNRYDKNENYGMDIGSQTVKFFEILFELFLGNYKITVSKNRELKVQKDFMFIAFDPPPEEIAKNG